MKLTDQVKTRGDVEIIKEYSDGRKEVSWVHNTILTLGRRALARTLANNLDSQFDFYINAMIWGDGGTVNGVKRYVDTSRNGLFGTTRIQKPVLANIDSSIPTQVIFTATIPMAEDVGMVLSEMALRMANGDLYSMVTFPNLTIIDGMQITFNWYLNFI